MPGKLYGKRTRGLYGKRTGENGTNSSHPTLFVKFIVKRKVGVYEAFNSTTDEVIQLCGIRYKLPLVCSGLLLRNPALRGNSPRKVPLPLSSRVTKRIVPYDSPEGFKHSQANKPNKACLLAV